MPGIKRNPDAFKELILPVFTQWSRVQSVTGILADVENGQFSDGALLWSQMLRDDRIAAVWDVFLKSVLGAPWHMEPHRDVAKATKVSDDATDLWAEMAPMPEMISLLSWGFGIGVGLARREWNGWDFTIKTWHPSALWYSLAEDIYYLRLAAQEGQSDNMIPILPGDPNWILFTPYGRKYARLNGYMRSLAMPYLMRQWASMDRARHSERLGQPIVLGIAPTEADLVEKKQFKSALANLGSESVVVAPQGVDGNKWGVELIEAMNNAQEQFGAYVSSLNEDIAVRVLGQSMSTTGQGGLSSKANPGDAVRGDIKKWVAGCIEDLSIEMMTPWSDFNYGAGNCCSIVYEVEPPKDGLLHATELNMLGDGLAKCEIFGVDTREILTQAGYPMLTEAEHAQLLEDKKAEAQAQLEAQAAMMPAQDAEVDGSDEKQAPV